MLQMSNQTMEEKAAGSYLELSKVILVVSQSHRISELDFESAQSILKSSMLQFPDLYFVFLSNDIDTFRDMVSGGSERRASVARMVRQSPGRYLRARE
jgi:hypothetical protein